MDEQILDFDGFGPQAVSYWNELQANNTKEFFAAHRDVYDDDIREPLERLLAEAADEFGDNGKVFRPHRDVRFSKDKSPYKLHCGAVIGEDAAGRTSGGTTSVFYTHVSASGLFTASGCYMMSRDQLQRFYAAIDDEQSGTELVRVVSDATAQGVDVGGSALKTAPRGYPADHPRIELLRHKSLTISQEFGPDNDFIFTADALHKITAVWRQAAPMNAWLATHVGPVQLAER